MKKIIILLAALSFGGVVTGCSTTGQFKIPEGTTLEMAGRTATPDASGEWKTSPFFWGSGDYKLKDKNGNVVRAGKLRTGFRAVSIFWPPAAIIYWPLGFKKGVYDLTVPADGEFVTDYSAVVPAPSAKAAAKAEAAAVKKEKKKKK